MGMIYVEQVEYMSVEQMQQTHEDEIKILNDIDKLAIIYEIKKTGLEELEKKINEYIEHVKAHFANEERLMQEYDFPSYDMHKESHNMFLLDLEYSIKQWKRAGDIKKIIYFIRKTPEWIVLHVNSVDAPTANFLATKIKES